jgi:hypothetical protein
MLIAAFIFVTCLAVIVQFGLLSWHAGLIRVTAEPTVVSSAALKPLISEGFANITAYGKLCPDFGDGSYLKLPSVRLYYRALQFLQGLTEANWANREMTLCTRYAAVMLSQHLERNQVMRASVRSF